MQLSTGLPLWSLFVSSSIHTYSKHVTNVMILCSHWKHTSSFQKKLFILVSFSSRLILYLENACNQDFVKRIGRTHLLNSIMRNENPFIRRSIGSF